MSFEAACWYGSARTALAVERKFVRLPGIFAQDRGP